MPNDCAHLPRPGENRRTNEQDCPILFWGSGDLHHRNDYLRVCEYVKRATKSEITMAEINYYLVSPKNALTGDLCILPFGEKELSKYASMRNYLNSVEPKSGWTICTNECPTIFMDYCLRFKNGRFERL